MVFLIKNSHYSLKCQNRSFLMLVLIIISVFLCLVNSNLNIISFFLTRSHFRQKKWESRAAVRPSHVLNKIWSLHLPGTSHQKDASQPSVPVSYALPNLSSWNTRAQFTCWHMPLYCHLRDPMLSQMQAWWQSIRSLSTASHRIYQPHAASLIQITCGLGTEPLGTFKVRNYETCSYNTKKIKNACFMQIYFSIPLFSLK